MPSERQQAWYVKASFGAEWGPMSADTLLTMADSGSFARDDVARCGLNDDWQPVPMVLDRLRPQPPVVAASEIADALPADDSSLTLPTSDQSACETQRPSVRSAPKGRRSSALPGWSNYWSPDSATTPPQIAQPQLAPTESVPSDETVTSATNVDEMLEESSRPETHVLSDAEGVMEISKESETAEGFTLLDAWKHQRKEQLDRLLRIVAEREAAVARAAQAAYTSTEIDRVSKASQEAAESTESSPQSESETTPSPTTASRKVVLPDEPWEQTLARWRRSLPDWKVFVTLLILPIVAWWCWPESYGNVAATYQSMYAELCHRRNLPQDKTGMNEFVERSQTKLDELIHWLERRASTNDVDSRMLLGIGRDCLSPMLMNPLARNSIEEANFNTRMTNWVRAHDRTSTPNESAEKTPNSANRGIRATAE